MHWCKLYAKTRVTPCIGRGLGQFGRERGRASLRISEAIPQSQCEHCDSNLCITTCLCCSHGARTHSRRCASATNQKDERTADRISLGSLGGRQRRPGGRAVVVAPRGVRSLLLLLLSVHQCVTQVSVALDSPCAQLSLSVHAARWPCAPISALDPPVSRALILTRRPSAIARHSSRCHHEWRLQRGRAQRLGPRSRPSQPR